MTYVRIPHNLPVPELSLQFKMYDMPHDAIAQPNMTDLNNNMQSIFETLNKLFKANQLTLNFDKTHYIHFFTKKDKSAKLMTGYNNKFVACTSSTKFLGHLQKNWVRLAI
jgi:hypothetical protein